MTEKISRLLETYEKGRLSRRDLVKGLALLAVGSVPMSAAGFQGNTINHVSLYVSDLQRSTEFYQRVFACPVNKRDGNNQLSFGDNFLVLRPGKPPGKIDHFAIGVNNFNQQSVSADLKVRGTTGIEDQANGWGYHIMDPDGFPVQIVDATNGR